MEQGIALCEPQSSHVSHSLYEPGSKITSLSWLAYDLCLLGYPDQALPYIRQCLSLTQEKDRPFSRAYVLCYAALCHLFLQEPRVTQELVEEALALSDEHGFAQWLAVGTIYKGSALACQGYVEEGAAMIQQGLKARVGMSGRPHDLLIYAEVCRLAGHLEDGLHTIAEALVTPGLRFDQAELHRLKGDLLLSQSLDNQVEAEACFQQVITIAQNQSAKSWELRAATSLAKLWQSQGKQDEAHELLEPVYGWFTEGFDTADLKDAKTLLDELK